MEKRALKYSTNYVVLTIIVLGILFIINAISVGHFFRIDLTENKEYTISEASKKVAAGIDDIINVKVYFSKDLPPYMSTLQNQVKDLLAEYGAFSQGKIKIEWVNPANDEETDQKMQRLGIPKIQLNIIAKDKQEVTAAYLGIAFTFEDRKEVIPVVNNISNLEYEVTTALIKVISKEAKGVGIFTGKPPEQQNPMQPQENDQYAEFRRELQKSYKVQDVNLSGSNPIPKDVKTLMVMSPENVSDRAKYEIDQFIMGGGQVVFMINPVKLENGLNAQALKTNLNDLASFYGVKLSNDLILDESRAMAAFNSGFVRFSVPYVFWPKIMKKFFAADHPVVNQLETLVFPWTGYVKVLDDRVKGKEVTRLVFSSDHSWTMKEGSYNLNPQQQFKPDPQDVASYPLAVQITGEFDSFYKGKAIPEAVKEPQGPDSPPPPPEETKRETIEKSPKTSLVFIANSNLVEDQFAQLFPVNQTFVLNLVDWLTMGDQLIGIRSRNVAERPLQEVSESAKTLVKLINMLGVPILVILFGLVRMVLSNRKRQLLAGGLD